MARRYDTNDATDRTTGLREAASAVRRGELVVLPTDTVAVRMPLHPVAIELLTEVGPMAVSSANLTGHPAPEDCDAAQEMLGDSVSVYLDGGPTPGNVPSSIVDVTREVPLLLRAGAISADELRKVVPDLEVAN